MLSQPSILLSVIFVLGGLLALVWSAGRFVYGASAIARNFGVSPMVIGLTIVGLGTSAPEMLISFMASQANNPGIAIGNAVGSNIANIGLVLGITALVRAVTVRSEALRREFPLMIGIMVLVWMLVQDGDLSRVDGSILMGGSVLMVSLVLVIATQPRRADPLEDEFEHHLPTKNALGSGVLWFVVGLAVLLVSSRLVVSGAVSIARAFEVSDLIIGLTIVAVGTSLPELAASVASVLKNEPDIAVGNILGSNMFNMLPVLAIPGLLAPGPVEVELLSRDLPVMLGLTLALFVMAFGISGVNRIPRGLGAVLLASFIAYQVLLYHST